MGLPEIVVPLPRRSLRARVDGVRRRQLLPCLSFDSFDDAGSVDVKEGKIVDTSATDDADVMIGVVF